MLYVDDPATLNGLCGTWAVGDVIAVDTEFERSVTYYPRPALIQISDGEGIWLVDPVAVEDLAPLGELLGRPTPLKLMHSALEDLTVLERATGHVPGAVFDTQLAAAFAGHGFGIGYHALVRALLGVEVSKDQTRSDWLQRPLSPAQIAYAAADVEHLHPMHEILSAQLDEMGRGHWLAEETRRVFDRSKADEVERDFLRIAGRVDDDQVRGVLRALVAWREHEARRQNRPRRHVVDDPLLVELARATPGDRQALESLASWGAHRGRARPQALLDTVSAARAASPVALPGAASDLSAYREILTTLKRVVSRAARDLSIEPALLAPRRLLEKTVVHVRINGHDDLPEELQGWRAPILADAFMESLAGG